MTITITPPTTRPRLEITGPDVSGREQRSPAEMRTFTSAGPAFNFNHTAASPDYCR